MDKNDIIKRIVTREFGRFVRYYQDAPELEEVTRKESDDAGRKKKERHKAQKGYTRFFINIGKKDHVQPVHIIEMLNRNVPGRVDVGRIDLMQSFSFFECPSEFAEEIVTGMNGINYKGRQIHVEIAEQRDENPDAGGYNERRKSYDGERKSSGRKTVRGERKTENGELFEYFSGIVPDFDTDRVYPSHIKKIISWYNLLVKYGENDFSAPEEAPEAE
jgi:ATP-dependent RNA helicase DeaD